MRHSVWIVVLSRFVLPSIGLIYCLYTVVICSLEWPYVVWVRALRILRLDFAFVLMFCECFLKVNMGSRVTPRMVGFGFTGTIVLKRVIWGCALIWVLCGVIKVMEDLLGETFILFAVSQLSIVWMYVMFVSW